MAILGIEINYTINRLVSKGNRHEELVYLFLFNLFLVYRCRPFTLPILGYRNERSGPLAHRLDLFTPHVDLSPSGKQKASVRNQLTSSPSVVPNFLARRRGGGRSTRLSPENHTSSAKSLAGTAPGGEDGGCPVLAADGNRTQELVTIRGQGRWMKT